MASFMTSTPEERFTDLMKNNPTLMNRVPQHQIASYLGVTPESLSRIKSGLIKKRISILNFGLVIYSFYQKPKANQNSAITAITSIDEKITSTSEFIIIN